jgi:hypothetical protein
MPFAGRVAHVAAPPEFQATTNNLGTAAPQSALTVRLPPITSPSQYLTLRESARQSDS